MSIKDLFDVKVSPFEKHSDSLTSASVGAESNEYIQAKQRQKEIYVPPIDFSTASNFAKYGSAKLYYEYAFKRIYNHYPYDGTLAEKVEFENESTHLDRYIFEYVYPRTNGYINLGYQGFDGSLDGSGYNDAVVKEYVYIKGGIHTASTGMTGKPISSTFDASMIYDVVSGSKKGSGLEFASVSGSTIEFWLKKDAFDATKATKEVIFDLWNQETEGDATYGRILLNIDNSNNFTLTWNSGSATGTSNIAPASLTIADSTWHHYAVSLKKDSSNMTIKFYQDGTLQKTTTNANDIGNIKGLSKGLCATIGALNTAPVGVGTLVRGDGKFSGSMDEFRYWKKALTPGDIGLNWFSQLGGGNNKSEYNKELGVYYKFNEGITATSQDSTVLDYSGRITNGVWTGYTSGARSADSAMVLSGKAASEFKDPIIYSYHPTVSAKQTEMQTSGSMQDQENTSLFYHLLPTWILEEDEMNGKNVEYLCQILASYFDTANAQIGAMNKVRNISYNTGSLSPNVLAKDVLRDRGFVMPELFLEADVLESFRDKDRNEVFAGDIEKVKNIIYQNIYNNLTYINKTKGTEKSFRNFFRCFGIDTELIKVNMYCDNSTVLVKDNYEYKTVIKPAVKFNSDSSMSSTVFQSSSGGITYITGSEGDTEQYSSLTLEADFILPKKLKESETGYFYTSFLSSSVAGFHRAMTSSASDYTWHTSDYYLRMYTVRDEVESQHVKFVLTGSGVKVSSSLYRMAYDNQKWLLAARVRHEDYPYAGITGSTNSSKNYIVEFYGVNTTGEIVDNGPFLVTASVSNAIGKSLLSSAKRVYGGAHRTNYTGSVLERSDVLLSQVRYWQSYLPDEDIKQHAFDSTNFGTEFSQRTDSLFATPDLNVPKIETLALHWDFGTVTGSNSSGEFVFSDKSSGSVNSAARYSFLGNITNRMHDGKGYGFTADSNDVVDKISIYSAKRRTPESAYSADGVNIVSEEKEAFFQDNDRNDIYFSFEKSPYGIISDEMINLFSTVQDFSNMIGNPINRYRHSYKSIDDLKQIFFDKIPNDPDPERYFEYFKWIDASVSYGISQLLPASARFSDSIKNVVESHLLERSKYVERLPFTAPQAKEPISSAKGAAELRYSWKHGHAPPPNSPIPNNKHCLWQKMRRKFNEPEPAPAPIAAEGIDTLRDNIHRNNNNKPPKVYDIATSQVYDGNTFAIRSLNKVYTFDAKIKDTIAGGVNYPVAKNRILILDTVKPHSPTTDIGGFNAPINILSIGLGAGQGLVAESDCVDVVDPSYKEKWNCQVYTLKYTDGYYSLDALNDNYSYSYNIKGIKALPMNLMSESVSTGYNKAINNNYKNTVNVANLHSDTIDISNEIPMQGPFVETWVGGHQSRHIPLTRYNTSLRDDDTQTAPPNNLDNRYTRAEAWMMLFGEHDYNTDTDGAFGFVPADYGATADPTHPLYLKYPDIAKKKATWFREEKAKRPVNIKNIKHDTVGNRVGNYNRKYEVHSTVGRKQNNVLFRVSSSIEYYLTPRIRNILPHTTHPMSLFGQMPHSQSQGPVFGYIGEGLGDGISNRQPDDKSGAKTTGKFTVTGSAHSGSASGSFRIKQLGLGGQVDDTYLAFNSPILGGAKNLIIESGSTATADAGNNYYVATGIVSTNTSSFWNAVSIKLNAAFSGKYITTYTVPSPTYSEAIYATGTLGGPAVAITASSISDFNIYDTHFAFSAWVNFKNESADRDKRTIFSFRSGSGASIQSALSREMYLTGTNLRYEAHYTNYTNPAQTVMVRWEWPGAFAELYSPGVANNRWRQIVLQHDKNALKGTGSAYLYIDNAAASSYLPVSPATVSTFIGGTAWSPSYHTHAELNRSDGGIWLLNSGTGSLGTHSLGWTTGSSPFVGHIDDITIWGGINLSVADRFELWNSGTMGSVMNCFISSSNIKAHYTCGDGPYNAGKLLNDSSGRGNNLESHGDVTPANTYIKNSTTVLSTTGTLQNEKYALFHMTAAVGGSDYNSTLVVSTPACQNFITATEAIQGGYLSGAALDDTIHISSSFSFLADPKFEIVNVLDPTPAGSNIPVSGTFGETNLQFWNRLSQSIKDHSVFGIINIVTSPSEAVFHLTSSDENVNYASYRLTASNMHVSNHTFYSASGFSGGATPSPSVFDVVLAVPGRKISGDNSRSEVVITSKFSAPGGPEVESAAYLDVYSREYSVHNAMAYRNLTVRGNSSGEAGRIRLNDHLGKREGLKSHLTRHCGKFGIDSKYGAVSSTTYAADASFYKQHRNTSMRYFFTGSGMTSYLGSRHDNTHIVSPLPRSEFQYGWINAAVSGSGSWRANQRITGYAPPSGLLEETIHDYYASFGSADSAINVGTAATWDALIGQAGTDRMAFSTWFRKNETDSSQNSVVFWFGGYSSSGCVGMYIEGVTNKIYFVTRWAGASKIWTSNSNVVEEGEWTHLFVSYPATSISNDPKIWINGTQLTWASVGSGGIPLVWNGIGTEDCNIGNHASGTRRFQGDIDNVTIWAWNHEAYSSDIYGLGRDGDPTVSYTSYLKAHYRFGSNSANNGEQKDSTSQFFDSSGEDNHSISVTNVTISDDVSYETLEAIIFPSASEIFGV